MTDKETMKLALEALELNNAEWKALADSGDSGHWKAENQEHYKKTKQVITALKERLAQPEQEPAALPHEMTPEMMRQVQTQSELGVYAAANFSGAYDLFNEFWRVAIAAAPQCTWAGLTPDEVNELTAAMVKRNQSANWLAVAIEFILKEKNT